MISFERIIYFSSFVLSIYLRNLSSLHNKIWNGTEPREKANVDLNYYSTIQVFVYPKPLIYTYISKQISNVQHSSWLLLLLLFFLSTLQNYPFQSKHHCFNVANFKKINERQRKREKKRVWERVNKNGSTRLTVDNYTCCYCC